MDDCCENLEQVIQRLREEFNDEENEQNRLAHRQQCLCRLVSIVMNFNDWWVIVPFREYNSGTEIEKNISK